MNKKLSLFVLFVSVLFYWCSKIDTEINYTENSEITWYEYSKLSYLLEWVIDIENDKADVWNKPLSTDEQKWRFIFDILNNNYMDKYENPIEAEENPRYPVLDDSFYINEWDEHDAVYPDEEWVKVAYKKSDIDNILMETFWESIKDWKNISQNWLVLSWDNYLFFNYLYYGSDLIWNKWRSTMLIIDETERLEGENYEINWRYYDDILEGWDDYTEWECQVSFQITVNPKSFFGVSVKKYQYSWCKIDKNYIPADLPSQIIYWFNSWMYNDYVWLKRDFKSVEENIDLNNDWKDEFFRIWVDSPNWSQILWVVWDKWYNFALDFKHKILDDNNDLIDGLFVDIYFENIDWWKDTEVLVAVWDKKTWSEAHIYKVWWEMWLEEIWAITWDSYLLFDGSSSSIHAPYSKNWLCKTYQIKHWVFQEI